MARVVIAAGGTAGHVVPAIAVADALRAEGAEVSFLGTRERAEADLVPAAGYQIDYLRVSGFDRRNPLKAAVAAWRAVARDARRAAHAHPAPSGRRAGWRRIRGRAGRPRRGQDRGATRADRGRQPSRPRQPAARAPRQPRLPLLPDPGQGWRSLRGHRETRAACRPRGGPDRRQAPLRDPGAGGLRDRRRRQPGRTLDQPGRVRRVHSARAGPSSRSRRAALGPARRGAAGLSASSGGAGTSRAARSATR